MNTAKSIVIDVDLRFADLYKGTLRMAVYVLRYLWGILLFFALLYAICSLVGATQSPWTITAESLESWLSPILMGGIPTTVIMIPLVVLVRVKMFQRSAGTDSKRRYTFSSERVTVETEFANAELKWQVFRQVRESKHYFLFYSAPGLANIIPKRCLQSEESLRDFRSLIREHVKKAKLQR
jgi:hypothetical protein